MISSLRVPFPQAMAASHPEMFRPSSVDESELLALDKKHLLPSRIMIQWRSAKGEDIPALNTKEIIVLGPVWHISKCLILR
jgi:hypothetical protein